MGHQLAVPDAPAGWPPVLTCAGVPITACDPLTAARIVLDRATGAPRSGTDVHLCNAYTLALADANPALRAVLHRASVNFPDGKSVVWANRLTHPGAGLPTERVYGPDLFRDVLLLGQPVGLRHYLLGSTPDTLAALQQRLRRTFPGALVVGADSPPFRPLTEPEWQAQLDRIRASGARLVWVGLGTPKQDWEAARLARALPVVAVAVGAAFDFVAGSKRQAPLWMQRSGVEWCFRLAQEPRRLWRRYLFGNARFVYAAVRWAAGQAAGRRVAAGRHVAAGRRRR
jgi:N-acetylglucosaminyldiphosphoundecaprenol N-acetyl-beta-D-mannosaminyltransferase